MLGVPFHVDAIDHVVLNCRDVDVTARWYAAALGVQVQTYDGGRTALTFGTQKMNLRPVGTADWETARTDAAGTLVICFVTTSSLDDVAATWRAAGIAVHDGPIRRTGARGAMTSLYAVDPDGNLVEVAHYD